MSGLLDSLIQNVRSSSSPKPKRKGSKSHPEKSRTLDGLPSSSPTSKDAQSYPEQLRTHNIKDAPLLVERTTKLKAASYCLDVHLSGAYGLQAAVGHWTGEVRYHRRSPPVQPGDVQQAFQSPTHSWELIYQHTPEAELEGQQQQQQKAPSGPPLQPRVTTAENRRPATRFEVLRLWVPQSAVW